MKLTIGFSPCPNDTFIFDAMIHHKIDTEELEFDVVFSDVEQLNIWALDGKLDVTKISYNALTHCLHNYALLDSGSALGNNCGPLLIKKPGMVFNEKSKIAIPGNYTTANMLLGIAFPECKNKIEILFSDIENVVLSGEVDAGVIIHESRFTYNDKGLECIMDLGEFWENEMNLPIPLGGIVVKRNLHIEIQRKIQRVIRKSVEYALSYPNESEEYVKEYAQEMDKEVVDAHINLYVNSFSVSLGFQGRNAVQKVFEKQNTLTEDIFVK